MDSAIDKLIRAVTAYHYNWSAWMELSACITSLQLVRDVMLNSDHRRNAADWLIFYHYSSLMCLLSPLLKKICFFPESILALKSARITSEYIRCRFLSSSYAFDSTRVRRGYPSTDRQTGNIVSKEHVLEKSIGDGILQREKWVSFISLNLNNPMK